MSSDFLSVICGVKSRVFYESFLKGTPWLFVPKTSPNGRRPELFGVYFDPHHPGRFLRHEKSEFNFDYFASLIKNAGEDRVHPRRHIRYMRMSKRATYQCFVCPGL